MSEITDILELDVSEYRDYLGADIAENLERAYHSGIVSRNDNNEIDGALVWVLCNSQSKNAAGAEIIFFEARDLEIAKKLFIKFTDMAAIDNVRRYAFEMPELTDEIREVFEQYGFKMQEKEGTMVQLTMDDVQSSKFMISNKLASYIQPISQIGLLSFKQGITNSITAGEKGLYEDLDVLDKEWFEEEVSCCAVQNKKMYGMFLVHRLPSGVLMPTLLYATGADANKTAINLLRYAFVGVHDRYPKDTVIKIRCMTKKTGILIKTLFPDKSGDKVIAGVARA